MIAIISDIHSNIEALEAVLADIAKRGVKKILCLGDLVGYGPSPNECLDAVMKNSKITLLGNHDYAVIYEPDHFNIGAEAACFWTREVIDTETASDKRKARWDFLGKLEVRHEMDDGHDIGKMTLVHGSPRRPINEYIFPDDVYNNPHKIRSMFDRFENICFVGHTHVPGVFVDTPDFYSPKELQDVFEIPTKGKAIINVGSVGQPRDRDNRACYAIIEHRAVRFVRVPYDIESVVKKIQSTSELDDYLGERLREGR